MSYAGPAPRRGATVEATIRAEKERRDEAFRHAESRSREFEDRPHATRWAMFGGLALGAALGAGIALLVAPDSGRETRQEIARRSRKLKRRGADAWDDLRHELGRAGRKAKDRLGAMRRDEDDC
jgi:YtxH-like protein